MTNAPFRIYLASTSPRRRELLGQLGVSYRQLDIDVPEERRPDEAPEVYTLRVALAKARAGRGMVPPEDPRPVLGADTVVSLEGQVLGKPRDRDDGLSMLERLCGRSHQVFTAVALVGRGARELSRLSASTVAFRPCTADEREAYWATGEPCDKAGAYGIQGLGAVFVQHLDGSYSGVMGLPLFETAELLAAVGIPVFAGQ